MQKEYFNMREGSLSPNPSPNGITPPNLPQGEEYLMGAGEKKPHPLSEPTVTDRREVMERGVKTASRMGEDDKWE